MADHNYTKYDYRLGEGIYNKECMMAIRDKTNIVDIYIPFKWLNAKITKEDVYRWVEFGNKTIFPATIEESYVKNTSYVNYNETNVINVFNGLEIKVKPNHNYRQRDATEVKRGTLNRISITPDGTIFTSTKVFYSETNLNTKYVSWGGYAEDHVVYATGECLDAYIKRTLAEQKSNEVKEEVVNNSFKISIDCGTAYSKHHKLAILSFYRFLWSCHFNGLVKNTLKIVDAGVDFWDALYYAMSVRNYNSYYGFIYQPGYVPMETVVSNLKAGLNINVSFTNAAKAKCIPQMSVNDFKLAVEAFKSGTINSSLTFKVKCNTDKLKTFTSGREYTAFNTFDVNKITVLKNDNYAQITVLRKHFE